jgi:hypothetical protein
MVGKLESRKYQPRKEWFSVNISVRVQTPSHLTNFLGCLRMILSTNFSSSCTYCSLRSCQQDCTGYEFYQAAWHHRSFGFPSSHHSHPASCPLLARQPLDPGLLRPLQHNNNTSRHNVMLYPLSLTQNMIIQNESETWECTTIYIQ